MLHVYRAQIKLCPEGPFGLGGGGGHTPRRYMYGLLASRYYTCPTCMNYM